jgi:hypothetical protein
VRAVGGTPTVVRSQPALAAGLSFADAVIVDLTARAYDGVDAVAAASVGGRPVLCVAQHDDVAIRRRALAAGASRVEPYRRLAEQGRRVLEEWLALVASGTTGPAAGRGDR